MELPPKLRECGRFGGKGTLFVQVGNVLLLMDWDNRHGGDDWGEGESKLRIGGECCNREIVKPC